MSEPRGRILIVDDDPQILSGLETLLSDEWEVRTAANGRDGITTFADASPDVVLLDVQLPDLDGFEVAARLRFFDHPPVVVLTSSRDGADYGRCIEGCGACGFVPKGDLSGAALAALIPA